MADIIKQVKDNEGNNVLPITHVNAVRDSNGDTLPDILDRDYPTTSKTPVEGSTEVSLVTRGEKYEWNKVGNATTSTTVAQTDGVVLKTTSGSYVEVARDSFTEAVRSVLGGLVANLDKGTGISAALGIDSNNDLGTITPANLASMLSDVNGYKIIRGRTQSNSDLTLSLGATSGIIFGEYSQTGCVFLYMFDMHTVYKIMSGDGSEYISGNAQSLRINRGCHYTITGTGHQI